MKLPKYFDELALSIAPITGKAIIEKINKKNPEKPNKYKDISDEEFKNTMMTYFSFYKEGDVTVQVSDDFTFLFAGKAQSKAQLIEFLNSLAKLVDNMDKEQNDSAQ